MYQRLIPKNIFISDFNEIYLKFPYWLLINNDINVMNENELNFFRYYLPPHLLFNLSKQNLNKICAPQISKKLLSNIDIWCLGCCIAEIFYGLPLFSSIDISDQFLKMFQILGYPDWTKSPWKYWKICDKFKKSIQIQQQQQQQEKENNGDCLNKMINNGAIVDLLRCCLQYSSEHQISLDQLAVFVDMFEINDKTENKQDRLTFNDIQSWNNDKNEINQDIVIIGASTFINQWSLKSPQKTTKKQREITNINNQKQKGVQTTKIKTNDSSTNTEGIMIERQDSIERNERIEREIQKIENDLNITDCINILPFSNKTEKENKKTECNLLIIEFSNICNLNTTLMMENTESFSFKCEMDKDKHSIFSSPIFNVDNLRQSNHQKQKVYIHIILKDKECKDILNDNNKSLNIQIISHNEYDKLQQEIGEINIDISMLKQYKVIEGYYHIFPISHTYNKQENNNGHKLGQVYVRVLPQFNVLNPEIEKEKIRLNNSDCNDSTMTDDQSIVSNEAWSMFNKFVKQNDQI